MNEPLVHQSRRLSTDRPAPAETGEAMLVRCVTKLIVETRRRRGRRGRARQL